MRYALALPDHALIVDLDRVANGDAKLACELLGNDSPRLAKRERRMANTFAQRVERVKTFEIGWYDERCTDVLIGTLPRDDGVFTPDLASCRSRCPSSRESPRRYARYGDLAPHSS